MASTTVITSEILGLVPGGVSTALAAYVTGKTVAAAFPALQVALSLVGVNRKLAAADVVSYDVAGQSVQSSIKELTSLVEFLRGMQGDGPICMQAEFCS